MKALILAAGYGTRLYPLTLDQPKPLLKVGAQSIADHIVQNIFKIDEINEILVVTNQKFSKHFENWAKVKSDRVPIKVINDGTLSNETRLGAIGDINLVLTKEKIDEDVLIIAGDNLFDLDLADFVKFAKPKIPGTTIAVRIVNDPQKIKKYGVITTDKNDLVIDFEEKPEKPKSNLAALCIYYFPKQKLSLVAKYLESKANKDAPGNYIAWLSKNDSVYTYKFAGEWFDIGDIESYKLADKLYKGRS